VCKGGLFVMDHSNTDRKAVGQADHEKDADGAEDARRVTDIPKDERFSAVICISEFAECPAPGIQSVLRNKAYFSELHLVQHGYDANRNLYPEYADDKEALAEAGITLKWHSRFDPDKAHTHAVVYVQPDMQVADGAMAMLHEEMNYDAKHAPQRTHFAYSAITSIRLTERQKRDPKQWFQSGFYGFLIVVMMLDWLRALFQPPFFPFVWNTYKYHKTSDLRAVTLSTTYPHRARLAPESWSWWLWNPGQSRIKSGGAALLNTPKDNDVGLPYVLRTIKLHNHLGYGWWVFGFAFYYMIFAWPWWNVLITRFGFSLLYPLMHDPWEWYWMLLYVLHTLVVAVVALMNMELPLVMLPLQVLLYTFYLTLFPLMLIYGRFHMSRAAWRHFTSSRGGGGGGKRKKK